MLHKYVKNILLYHVKKKFVRFGFCIRAVEFFLCPKKWFVTFDTVVRLHFRLILCNATESK